MYFIIMALCYVCAIEFHCFLTRSHSLLSLTMVYVYIILSKYCCFTVCFPISLQCLVGLKALKRRTRVVAAMPPEKQSSNTEAVSFSLTLYIYMADGSCIYKITFFGSGKKQHCSCSTLPYILTFSIFLFRGEI